MPYVQVNALAASEGAGFIDVVVSLDRASNSETRVSFETLAGSANYASSLPDFQRASGTLIFQAGETSRTVRVTLVDNAVAEGTEAFWFQLANPVNASILQPLTPVLIFDNDGPAGTPRISVSDVVVDERAKTANFFVSLSQPASGTVGVSYATANDTALAASDYEATSGLLSFAPGEMVKTVSVPITDDTTAEADEFFKLVLGSPTNATILNDTGRARIGANDATPVSSPYITAKAVAASEGQLMTTFVVQLSAPGVDEVRVNFDTFNGSASYSSATPDFQRVTGTLIFAPGETTRLVSVPLIDDTTIEKPEAFWLDLSNPVNATVAQKRTPGLIYDNDAPAGQPIVQVSSEPYVDERTGTVNFFVWLDKPSSAVINMNWVIGSDTAGSTDVRLVSGTISFAPGETVKTVTTSVLDDTTAEGIESFKLVLTNAAGTDTRISDFDTTTYIAANDGAVAATPYLRAIPAVTDEAQALAGFTVLLSAPSSSEVRVNYDTVDGTAHYGTTQPEYQRSNGTLVFLPGETVKFVPVVVFDDSVVENPSSFFLELSSAVNATVEQRLVPGLVYDNDGIGNGDPLVSVSDAVVDEQAGTATFFLTLNRPATQFGFISYKTVDGTAVAGSDYRASSGSAHIMPGESTTTVTVPIIDDGLAETEETFQLVLTQGVAAKLFDAVGTAVIGRSDGATVDKPVISVNPITVTEADPLANFLVRLSAPSNNEVRVTFDLANGTASFTSSLPDFLRITGTLIFAPGETVKTIAVPLVNNNNSEGTETFNLVLSSPFNATLASTTVAATILDDDSAAVLMSFGIGDDIYTVTAASDRIAESPNGGIDTVKSSVSYTLPDNVENLLLSGSATSGIGNAGDNVFRGTAAANSFDGKDGIDTAVFSATQAASTVTGTAANRTVSSPVDGTDTLLDIERLQFSDSVAAYDTSPGGHVYNAYAMWNAAFNAAPSTKDLSQWTAMLDRLGGNMTDLAQTMINAYAPGVSNEGLVSYLWGTIIGGTIPADQLALFTGLITAGTYTQASLLALVATLDLNTVEIAAIVGQPQALDPAYFPLPG